MTPSSDSCTSRDVAPAETALAFPDQDGFRSLPPPATLAQMIERARQFRQWFPDGLRSPAERWEAKSSAEFHL